MFNLSFEQVEHLNKSQEECSFYSWEIDYKERVI